MTRGEKTRDALDRRASIVKTPRARATRKDEIENLGSAVC